MNVFAFSGFSRCFPGTWVPGCGLCWNSPVRIVPHATDGARRMLDEGTGRMLQGRCNVMLVSPL